MLIYLGLIIFRLLVLHVESLFFVFKTAWKVQKLFLFPKAELVFQINEHMYFFFF